MNVKNPRGPKSPFHFAATASERRATPMTDTDDALHLAPTEAVQLRGDAKRDVVRTMFDRIAPTYDRLNLIISLGQTSWWRRRALRRLDVRPAERVLDVGCGTGWVVQYLARSVPGVRIEGMDLSPGMLAEARRLDPEHTYFEGDVRRIDRADASYDVVCTVFTSRNFPDLEASVAEMMRVLRPGGRLMVLDSFPAREGSVWGRFQSLWMGRVVPVLVRPFADPKAYGYLAESILNHVPAEQLAEICRAHGADAVELAHYSFGSATAVIATRGGAE